MTDYAVDTNVVSELVKPAPHPSVIAFFAGTDGVFWMPSLVVHELEYGLAIMPLGRRRDSLRAAVDGILLEYQDRILPLDRAAAEWAALYRAQIRRAGREPNLADLLIAGTAKSHDLTLSTRNVRDFAGLDLPLHNPWGRANDNDSDTHTPQPHDS